MSQEKQSGHYFELRTVCPMGDGPVTVLGEPRSGSPRIVDCSRWHQGHRCHAECAPQVSLEYAVELARRVQEMLEPRPFLRLEDVSVSSWLSVSQRVGGDFQSIYLLGRRIVAIQGDVMGKGINAALMAAYLVGMFEGLAQQALPISEALTRMNRAVAERTREQPMFATALALEVDLAARQWSFARAGHETPLLFRRDGYRCRLVSGGSLPLGVDGQERFSVFHLPLEPGDRLLVYSDGTIESGLGREELMGLLRASFLTMEEIVGRLPYPPPYRDDVSLLLLTCDHSL